MRKLNTKEAATYLSDKHGLSVAARTLDNYAWGGRGPAFYKAATGRRLYDPADLDAWAADALGAPRRSTSDAA
jgi:hypothetical protein